MRSFFSCLFVAFFLLGPSAFSQVNGAELDARAREIGQSLRCVVCQNQSIDESDAPLAQDMRKLVKKRLIAGDSNADVIAFMRETYGDYVLLKPPVQRNTYPLWGLPFLILIVGLTWFFISGSKKRSQTTDKEETSIK
ncbi:cytochrome c-type biogenesis protein CcmH [Litorimonas taeanensis]|uniref:Cytochrome c-type biogenesis protein n=1 Tax=Litorimonas taeanensis TaxID=568099 RepID=A0A420WIG1_9PROT|nr:cytochrome c-type biogenesis protein [Litorimonas taeanensis]RKQ70800.1 cytochrome c-type biogenesis protein CcmH [Litorimonas taeanensis]